MQGRDMRHAERVRHAPNAAGRRVEMRVDDLGLEAPKRKLPQWAVQKGRQPAGYRPQPEPPAGAWMQVRECIARRPRAGRTGAEGHDQNVMTRSCLFARKLDAIA